MKFEVRKKFSISVERLFEYFVYYNECDQWMEYEDWNGLILLLKDGVYFGFEIPNPDPRMEPLRFEVDSVLKNEYVIYKSAKANSTNVHVDSRAFFPFQEMNQALYFRSLGAGSEMPHIIEFVPKGIIGWFTCRFIVKPQLLSGIRKSSYRLEQHINA